ncbi:hypothetical protein [Salinicola avicenniae]|uniref:hypothetical protein n=1 Tax=Salinicola avicenniae TaxID=2916836 RepID=UPI00207326AB|nr:MULTISPECIES: hypothetical protein [unclassified Salinicola]
MNRILGYDHDDTPLRQGDSVRLNQADHAAAFGMQSTIDGVAVDNNPDDAVQRLCLANGNIVYDVHCSRA